MAHPLQTIPIATQDGTLKGKNTEIELKIYNAQSSQAVQCMPAKNKSFLCCTQSEESSAIEGSDGFINNRFIQKQRNLTEKMFEKWDLKNFMNSPFYFFPLKDNSNSLFLPYKTR